jgi:phosphatidylglycerophosphatase A
MTKFWLAIATGLGAGYAPVASGTFGTLVGIPIVFLLMQCCTSFTFAVATAAIFFVGVKAAGVAEWYYEESDSGKIVIDEIVGYMITMFLIPMSAKTLIIGFFLFRFFDVVKIWPARHFDRSPGPWAVMLDDVFAGLYSNIALHFLIWFHLLKF